MKRQFIFLAMILLSISCANGQKKSDCRIWNEYVEAYHKGQPSMLPDFSYAGYHHGETGVPDAVSEIFNVCDYGAVPDDGQSDREAFVKAVRAAEQHGSGIIYFPKGRYHLRPENAENAPVRITCGNIVLRGEGCGKGGSEIFMEYPNPALNPKKLYSSPVLIEFAGNGKDTKLADVTQDSQKGTFQVTVNDASSIKEGDWVCLYLKNADPEVIAQELHPYEPEAKWGQLLKEGVLVEDYHLVTGVDGNVITFKEPLMHAVESDWNWIIKTYQHISEVGVEDLSFVGNWHDKFVHHKNWLHDGGYKFLRLRACVNSWVRRCRLADMSEGISIAQSANVSVTECVIDGVQGHAAMRAQGSSRVFFGKIEDRPAMWHSVGFSKPSMGTVLWKIRYSSNSCFESHASQPRASLIDACEGGFMRGHAGGAVNCMPNHLQDLVFWNFKETDEAEENFDFWPSDTPFWRIMPPIIVGFHGNGTTFMQSKVAYEESHGTPVTPASLYEAQLKLRLGFLPDWFRQLDK